MITDNPEQILATGASSRAILDARRLAVHMAYAQVGMQHHISAPPRPIRSFFINLAVMAAALTIVPLGVVLLLKLLIG